MALLTQRKTLTNPSSSRTTAFSFSASFCSFNKTSFSSLAFERLPQEVQRGGECQTVGPWIVCGQDW